MKKRDPVLVVWFAVVMAVSAHADPVLVLDQPAFNAGVPGWGGPNNNGQSFSPADAGAFPGGSAYLLQFTFTTSGQASNHSTTPTYLSIYSDVGGLNYVGSSTNTQDWNVTETLLTWNFDALPLTATGEYYAYFSTAPMAGGLITQPLIYSSSDPYAGGDLFNNGVAVSGYDAKFSATFATVAVPEPATWAVIAGAGVLGVALWRRRRRAGDQTEAPAGEC